MVTFDEFCEASRVVLVAGKGGVGKTTVGVALADAAARAGRNVLLVELEGHSDAGRSFGVDTLGYEPAALDLDAAGSLAARHLAPDDALLDYLGGHGLLATAGRLLTSGAVDVISTAAPGIRDLLGLGKIRSLATEGDHDLIVVDAPASGHARSFLTAPTYLAETASSGPIREQAVAAQAFLRDPAAIRVVLVTLAEETPVNETIETAFTLDDEVGVALGPVVVNAVRSAPDDVRAALDGADPDLAVHDAVARHLAVADRQRMQIRRLTDETGLAPLELPWRPMVELTPQRRTELADALVAAVEASS